jgi:DNA-binding Lrp family transcriptional regulator
MKKNILDEIDTKILNILQEDCRKSLDEISKTIDVPKSTVYYRIKRLESLGVIEGYYAKVNPKMLGNDYFTITLVKAKYGPGYHKKIGRILSRIKGVWAVYYVLGEYDFVVLARAKNRENFIGNILEKFINYEEIERTNTIVIVDIINEDPRVDIEHLDQEKISKKKTD